MTLTLDTITHNLLTKEDIIDQLIKHIETFRVDSKIIHLFKIRIQKFQRTHCNKLRNFKEHLRKR